MIVSLRFAECKKILGIIRLYGKCRICGLGEGRVPGSRDGTPVRGSICSGRVTLEVSPGVLLDRIAQLEVRIGRQTDGTILRGQRAELAYLEALRAQCLLLWQGQRPLVEELKEAHGALADANDQLHACMRDEDCGPRMAALACAAHIAEKRCIFLRQQLDERLGGRQNGCA